MGEDEEVGTKKTKIPRGCCVANCKKTYYTRLLLLHVTTAEIPGQTTRKTTTQKLPDLQNHIDPKPPFSASNYKKVTLRQTTTPPLPPTEDEQRNRNYYHHQSTSSAVGLQNASKNIAKPTKASVEHILKQAVADNTGSRQTHLIRSASQEEEELPRDMFDSSAQSVPPAKRLLGWVLCLLASAVAIIVG